MIGRSDVQANDGVRRVSELQKEVSHCKQELQACKLAAHQAATNIAALQVSCCRQSVKDQKANYVESSCTVYGRLMHRPQPSPDRVPEYSVLTAASIQAWSCMWQTAQLKLVCAGEQWVFGSRACTGPVSKPRAAGESSSACDTVHAHQPDDVLIKSIAARGKQ